MKNQTTVNMLILAGLSDLPSLQLPLFMVFLLIYLMTLTGNLIIFFLIIIDFHLHTPMYFFLGTLACLDMSNSSVTVPRMLFDLFTQKRVISVSACRTQIYFFFFFFTSEVSLLSVMSCDRYIAICRPLHYMQIMSWKVCVWLLSLISCFGALNSLLHTVFLSKITFCRSKALQNFFCDLPQFLQISCSDTFINVLLIYLLGILFGVGPLGFTFYPYFPIISTVLKIPSNQVRSKTFSTCSSHLTVVFIFYITVFFNYFRSYANDDYAEDKVASVFYAVLTPFLNPLIYSLRNQELKSSLKRALQRLQFFKNTEQKNYNS